MRAASELLVILLSISIESFALFSFGLLGSVLDIFNPLGLQERVSRAITSAGICALGAIFGFIPVAGVIISAWVDWYLLQGAGLPISYYILWLILGILCSSVNTCVVIGLVRRRKTREEERQRRVKLLEKEEQR